MRAGTRLALYAGGLAVLLGGSAAVANALVPEGVVEAWTADYASHGDASHGDASDGDAAAGGHDSHGGDTASGTATGETATEVPPGTTLAQDGYVLEEVGAPAAPGQAGELSFRVTGPDGAPLTDYVVSHEKELHLVVVRSDGTGFRHVHPTMDADGVWSLPWEWEAAGTYRVYGDFLPAGADEGLTLTRTVEVAGEVEPAEPEPTAATVSVDGFDVTLDGALEAGSGSELTLEVTRDGRPVTLEPYLGAFGHLVALRAGDLAYLHVHPEGEEPAAGDTSEEPIVFATEAPTAGPYFLYLDFQVDGQVRTATFTVDAETGTGADAGTGSGSDAYDSEDHDH